MERKVKRRIKREWVKKMVEKGMCSVRGEGVDVGRGRLLREEEELWVKGGVGV